MKWLAFCMKNSKLDGFLAGSNECRCSCQNASPLFSYIFAWHCKHQRLHKDCVKIVRLLSKYLKMNGKKFELDHRFAHFMRLSILILVRESSSV